MEYNWNLLNNNASSWDLGGNDHAPPTSAGLQAEAGGFHALMLRQEEKINGELHVCALSSSSFLYPGSKELGYHNPDPHLTCLKLGKRQYLPRSSGTSYACKKGRFCDPSWGKPSGPAAVPAASPRCQVEGCGATLANAKDYHRRHKVCESHAKAPIVVVGGKGQRFCQQCSRFHDMDEFDESKRSCRRRLAGHNERRRKSSQVHFLTKRSVQEMKMMAASRNTHHFPSSSECALSLLSSTKQDPCSWDTSGSVSPDLPAGCSAALRELIAENRASILACSKNTFNSNHQLENSWIQNRSNPRFLNSSSQQTGGQLTLDLMRASSTEFGMFSMHMHDYDNGISTKLFKGGNDQQECSALWRLPLGY